MKRKKVVYIIFIVIGAVLLGLGALAWYLRKPSYDWNLTYNINSVEPYGTKLLKELMEAADFKIQISLNGIGKKPPAPDATYFFIGNRCHLGAEQWETLKAHVEAGGQAVIISNSLPTHFNREMLSEQAVDGPAQMYPDEGEEIQPGESETMPAVTDSTMAGEMEEVEEEEYEYGSTSKMENIKTINTASVCATINHDDAAEKQKACYTYMVKDGEIDIAWTYLDDPLFRDTLFVPLGHIGENTMANCFSYRHGKGQFIFHTSPLFFTNFNVLSTERQGYLYHFLAKFKSREIYWDTYAQRSHSGSLMNFSESPLIFIMNNYYLRNAWYLFLLGVLLFLVFGVKRVQRPIPVLPMRRNSTLEYLKVLAQLFFRDNNNKAIAAYLTRSFLLFVRKRYNINLEGYDREQLTQLQYMSGVELGIIENIFAQVTLLYSADARVNSEELTELNRNLNEFYKDCL
jgi:hypothetical protein